MLNNWKKDFEKELREKFKQNAFFSLCENCNARVYEHAGYLETADGMITFKFVCPECKTQGQKISRTGRKQVNDMNSKKDELLKGMFKPSNIKKIFNAMKENKE